MRFSALLLISALVTSLSFGIAANSFYQVPLADDAREFARREVHFGFGFVVGSNFISSNWASLAGFR